MLKKNIYFWRAHTHRISRRDKRGYTDFYSSFKALRDLKWLNWYAVHLDPASVSLLNNSTYSGNSCISHIPIVLKEIFMPLKKTKQKTTEYHFFKGLKATTVFYKSYLEIPAFFFFFWLIESQSLANLYLIFENKCFFCKCLGFDL